MSTKTIIERLALNCAEIEGVNTALELQPTKSIERAALPLTYIRPMGMPVKVPGTSTGAYIVTRRYMIACLIGLTQGASLDSSTEGSALLQAVMPFMDGFVDYFMSHLRLKTVTLREMILEADVEYIDNGPEIFKAVDGQEYAGIRPILTIAERRTPSPKGLS